MVETPWQELVNAINREIAIRAFDQLILSGPDRRTRELERSKMLAFIDGLVKAEVEYSERYAPEHGVQRMDEGDIERLYKDIYEYFDIPITWLKVWW